jgi:hypothetical protein
METQVAGIGGSKIDPLEEPRPTDGSVPQLVLFDIAP